MSVCFISGRTKDSVHLIHNNYRFSKDRTRNGTIYWRCMMSRRTQLNPVICKARISTDKNGNVLTFGQEHNHSPDETEIKVRKCISAIKRVAEYGTNDVINTYVSELPEEVKEKMPSRKALQKCAQRSRKRSTTQYNPSFIQSHNICHNLGYKRLPMVLNGKTPIHCSPPHTLGYKRLPEELNKPILINSLPIHQSKSLLTSPSFPDESSHKLVNMETSVRANTSPSCTTDPNMKPNIELPSLVSVLNNAQKHVPVIGNLAKVDLQEFQSNMLLLLNILKNSNTNPTQMSKEIRTDENSINNSHNAHVDTAQNNFMDEVLEEGIVHAGENKENIESGISVAEKLLESLTSDNRLDNEALDLIKSILDS